MPYLLLLAVQFGIAQSSVLSSGSWYRMGVTESGVYKIDLNTLNALGVGGTVDPRNISIFGNGWKGVLPQPNDMVRPEDLLENAIFISGESDGSFDSNDYILFYGVGPDKIVWEESGLEYEKNFYADTAYYFLRIGGANGKRLTTKSTLSGTASVTVTSFNDHIVFEEDEINLISSGRSWFGEPLQSGESQSFNHQIDGLSSDIELHLNAVSQSSKAGVFAVSSDGNEIGAIALPAVPDGPGTTYSIKAYQADGSFTLPNSNSFTMDIAFDGNESGERGFLDYYTLSFLRNLQLYNNETDFRWIGNSGELVRYELANASNATVWDVSDLVDVKLQEFTSSGSSIVFQSQSAEIEEFVVFRGSDFPSPFIFGAVSNQDLRGNTNLDGVIVTHPLFKQQAEELAQFHRNHDGLDVEVVTTKQVYNEFSSGRQDVTAIRDYARYIYENGGKLKYLLLFGDCSYDYKDRISNNSNFVPTYESRDSFSPIFSHSSDDYFGFMEADEGEWEEDFDGDHTMELGVGRLPAKTQVEAQVMVDKIIYYSTNANTLGKWRSEMAYVADDGDFNIHTNHVENLSELIDTTYAQYKISKILLDAFTQEASGSSEKSPQASAVLKTQIKSGTFLINYIGHGNERLWMEEEILTQGDIAQLTNRNKLPIFVTATCEFGRYDDPIRVSGAEDLLLLEQGGGIALLTTSRPVFASTNFMLNQAFHENIFRKVDNSHLRLGDIIRLTKNEGLAGPVNRNFTLLGDPMMMPAFPKLDIVLNEIGIALDTLSALEEITFTGEIQQNGNLRSDFNGILNAAIFDVKQSFQTKGQESNPTSYTLRSNALFRGEATVEDGEFSFSFIVPKNISYQYQKGKMSLYAWDEELNIDAGGSTRSFVIGGTADSPVQDDTPPQVQAFMNDSSFVNGDQVGASPLFIARIEDESGITTARSGVVQGITLTLENQVINLNGFYTAEPNTFKKGTVVYPLQNLDPGSYTGVLKVWDTHNNATETTIDFVVSDEPILFIYNPIAYPNPVIGSTTFSFEHDREDEDLAVSLLIYSPKGEVVSQSQILLNNSQRTVQIPWRAQTNSGESLKQGIYYSRLIIKSRLDGAIKEITQKLVIVN